MSVVNVIPLDDLKEHTESQDCECKPKIKVVEGGTVIIHNSYDGREFLEQWEAEKSANIQ